MFTKESPWYQNLWKGEGSKSSQKEKLSSDACPLVASANAPGGDLEQEWPFRFVLHWAKMVRSHPDQPLALQSRKRLDLKSVLYS